MDYVFVDSNRFKVKIASKFKQDFDSRVRGSEVNLQVHEDGFQIWAVNPYIIDPNSSDKDSACSNMDIADIVRPHLRKGQEVVIKVISRIKGTNKLTGVVCVVTELATEYESMDTTAERMLRDLYPRYVTCIASSYNSKEDLWIEEGKSYLAVDLRKTKNRWYHTIDQKGRLSTWSKENFNGGTED